MTTVQRGFRSPPLQNDWRQDADTTSSKLAQRRQVSRRGIRPHQRPNFDPISSPR